MNLTTNYTNRHTFTTVIKDNKDYAECCKKTAQEYNVNFIEIKSIDDAVNGYRLVTFYFTFKD